ncbi:hypothetical protein NC652_002878 [Populus alba x Populus x berolinensis]|nr:hypothetical protein NC652_002878 [Populus alba x Populus x berolinensis]
MTKFNLVTVWNWVDEGGSFSTDEKSPMTSKELNEEPYG